LAAVPVVTVRVCEPSVDVAFGVVILNAAVNPSA
jgi:hypothetical protein